MKYKPYGRTGLHVSAVGFGGMRFDITRPVAENADLVRYANACGITYFDTAPGYCNDQSEAIFGEAFKSMPGTFRVSTKGMPTEFDTATKARDAVRRSLDRMGIPKIHFYHVWCLRKMEHYELAMRKALDFQHNWGLLVGRKASADACVTCGKCEEACTQHLPICKRLATIAAWEAEAKC